MTPIHPSFKLSPSIQNRHSTTDKMKTPSDQNLTLSNTAIDILNIVDGLLDRQQRHNFSFRV